MRPRFVSVTWFACLWACSSGGGAASNPQGGGAVSAGGSCLAKTRDGITDNCTDFTFAASAPAAARQLIKDACDKEGNADAPLVGTWAETACAHAGIKGGCGFASATSSGTIWYYRQDAAATQASCAHTYTEGKANAYVPPPQ